MTAKGMVFITLEDETGFANLVLAPDVFERCRPGARDATLMLAEGRIERQGEVVNVRVRRVERFEPRERVAGVRTREFR